jgi:hypothetical protein
MNQELEPSESQHYSSNENPMDTIMNKTKKVINDVIVSDEITRPIEDAFLYLMQAHRLIAKHIKIAQEATTHEDQEKHCGHVIALLTLHAKLEEATLYPALEKRMETHDLVDEAYEEHSIAKDLLEELGAAEAGSDSWKAKLTVLKENIEHHVLEEEGELFPKARDVLSDAEQETLATNMEQFLQGYEK